MNNNKEDGTGAKCVEFGKNSDFLVVSGHGVTTKAEIWGEEGYGLSNDTFEPSDIKGDWNNGEVEWVLFAACSQVSIAGEGKTAQTWIKAMPKVHILMGYSFTAPSSPSDVQIAQRFCDMLKGVNGQNHEAVAEAWIKANIAQGAPGTNAKALVRWDCNGDKMYTDDKFPTGDPKADSPNAKKYKYYKIVGGEMQIEDITIEP